MDSIPPAGCEREEDFGAREELAVWCLSKLVFVQKKFHENISTKGSTRLKIGEIHYKTIDENSPWGLVITHIFQQPLNESDSGDWKGKLKTP